MNVIRCCTILSVCVLGPMPTRAQESAAGAGTKSETPAAEVKQATSKVLDRTELEAEFRRTLTGAVLSGSWQMTGKGGLSGADPLTEPKPEKYSIASAAKVGEHSWLINARIQFGDKDVAFPVPVRVVWAEDTAIITVNDLTLPLLGTYSARVMIHKGFYTGVWYCGAKNYGGVMSGRIIKEEDVAKVASPAEESVNTPSEKGK